MSIAPDCRIVLTLDGTFAGGSDNGEFRVRMELFEGGDRPIAELLGHLPADPELAALAEEHWRVRYRSCGLDYRLEPKQILRLSPLAERYRACLTSAQQLCDRLNAWLSVPEFRAIEREILVAAAPDRELWLTIRTADLTVQKLPWHAWKVPRHFARFEWGLGRLEARSLYAPPEDRADGARILATFGHAALAGEARLNLEGDLSTLAALPGAQLVVLPAPSRAQLFDALWQERWDVLFFAGHSHTDGDRGRIDLNGSDRLTVADLANAIDRAAQRGLQIALLNSCDGLGLAWQLGDLRVPFVITMREAVPDRVAVFFLERFLQAYSRGDNLYRALGDARQQLQSLEGSFPCASWLPVTYQHPSATAPTWSELTQAATLRQAKLKEAWHSALAIAALRGGRSLGTVPRWRAKADPADANGDRGPEAEPPTADFPIAAFPASESPLALPLASSNLSEGDPSSPANLQVFDDLRCSDGQTGEWWEAETNAIEAVGPERSQFDRSGTDFANPQNSEAPASKVQNSERDLSRSSVSKSEFSDSDLADLDPLEFQPSELDSFQSSFSKSSASGLDSSGLGSSGLDFCELDFCELDSSQNSSSELDGSKSDFSEFSFFKSGIARSLFSKSQLFEPNFSQPNFSKLDSSESTPSEPTPSESPLPEPPTSRNRTAAPQDNRPTPSPAFNPQPSHPRPQNHRRLRATARRLAATAAIAAIAGTGAIALQALGILEPLELKVFDTLLAARSKPLARDRRILVVAIESEDLAYQDAQGFQRGDTSLSNAALARLLDRLEPLNPSAIALDVYRPEGFGDAIAPRWLADERFLAACKAPDPASGDREGVAPPAEIPIARVGLTDVLLDRDGILRRQIVAMTTPHQMSRCTTEYGLAPIAAQRYFEAQYGLEPEPVAGGAWWTYGDVPLHPLRSQSGGYGAVDAAGYQLLLGYRQRDFWTISLREALESGLPDRLADRLDRPIVLVGTVARSETFNDFHRTPLGEMPGVLWQAQAIAHLLEGVLDGKPLLRAAGFWRRSAWTLGLAGLAVAAGDWAARRATTAQRRRAALAVAAGAIALAGGATAIALAAGWWLPAIGPLVAGTGGLGLAWLVRRPSRAGDPATIGRSPPERPRIVFAPQPSSEG